MGGGGIKQSQNDLSAITGQQKAQSLALSQQGGDLIAKGQSYLSPLENFTRSILGGNQQATNQVLAPALTNISDNAAQTKQHIYDSTGPGVGRDVLLGENQRNTGGQIAQLKNQAFLQSFPELASLSGGETSAGLGLTGAGVTSLGNAATSTGTVLNSKVQQKSATLGALGNLAGAAGFALGGPLGGSLAKGIFGKAAGGGGASGGGGGGGW